jgi:acetylglutamate kinase
VTDRETRDVAVMVLGGLLNKRLSASITAAGQPAIGISAADGACFSCAPLVHNDVEGRLGFVGYLTGVKTAFLQCLWRENLLPVASCLGFGADGELYNINADHMAAACAEFIAADHLIYLTDVAGVLDGDTVISAISCEQIERLVQARVVSGGMVLKLEAAKRALEGGVREVHIVGGDSAAAVLDPELFTEASNKNSFASLPGTRVLRESASTGIASQVVV